VAVPLRGKSSSNGTSLANGVASGQFKEAPMDRRDFLCVGAGRWLPVVGGAAEWAEKGALLTFGPDLADMHRRTARFVVKVFRGAKPADLPVEQPTKFELSIYLKPAKALSLTVPPSLLLRADRLIQ